MYSCHPTEALRASQIPKHFDDVNSCRGQLTINFSSKTTCSDDYSPGVCDSTVIDIPVNVNGSNGNITEQYIQGDENYKVSWKFLLNEIQFDFDCKTRGWAAIGFDKGSRIHQNTDTYIAWILSSGTGVIQDGFSNAQSQPLSDPSQNAIVLSASQEGQNFKLSFKRPLKGPELQDIEISDSSLLVGWAYHPTNNPNSDVPLIQHTARGSTRRNLFTGVGEKYVKPVSPALYYIYAILCVFGIYALIRWLYKFYKLICRSREQRNEDSQLNSSSYFVGSQKVPYSPSAASTTFGSQRGLKSPSGFGSVKLKSQSAFDLIEPDLKSSSLLPKKPHYAFVNAVYGMVHARIFGTHISVMDILIETLIFSINAFFLILYSPSRGFSQVEAWGYLCTANSLLVALPATRNSVLVWILGVPFDKAILHHRWLGRIVVIEATVHFALSIDKTLTNSKYLWGLGAFISLAFILLTSVSYLRRKLFNVFFYSHHAFFAFYILASLHSREFQTYAIAAGIIYVLDRMVRMAWGIYPQKATSVEALPGNVVKIRFPKSCAGRYDVGQYVFLNFPQLNMLEWHPFTLSSGPHEAEAEVSIKGLGNFTGKLREWKAENPNSTLWVRCDGPYGSWPFNYARYPSILLACGGVGVTPCIAVLRHIYGIRSTKSHYEPILKNVHFVWSCKTDEDFLWFKTEILQAMEKSGKHFPKLHLHIHITGSRHASHAMLKIGRPEFEPIFDQIKEETPRAFVVACGPSSMVNEVWDLSVNKSMSKVRFDFHHETFEF
jgi:predicted ferric reductase